MSDCTEPCPLQVIDSYITELNTAKEYLDGCFKDMQGKTQAEIDSIITNKINPYINGKLKKSRDGLLKSLQDEYSCYKKCAEPATTIMGMDVTNLTSCMDMVKEMKKFIVGAYQSMVDFVSLFPTHLTNLSGAMNNMVNYNPPITGIDTSALNISIEPITMQDITGES